MRAGASLVVAMVISATSVQAADILVDQAGQKFSQKLVTLDLGQVLIFANRDDVTHNINVINDNDEATDLGLQKPEQLLSYKFDKAGRFKIRCSIHPSMKMVVIAK